MTLDLATVFLETRSALMLEVPGVSIAYGRRALAQSLNQGAGLANRIVWHEGDPGGGSGGEVAPRGIGANPRSLKDAMALFTVYLWGYDGSVPDGAPLHELAQHQAAWRLFCTWRRHIFKKYENWVAIQSRRWQSPDRIERPFGKELQVICTLRTPVEDITYTDVTGLHSVTTIHTTPSEEIRT